MKKEVILFVNGGGVREKMIAQAEESFEENVPVFRFFADGAGFTFRLGEPAVIERTGGVAYRIVLDKEKITHASIATEFGFLSAEVKTLRSEIQRKNGLKFKGEYEIYYDGLAQRHEVSFYAETDGRALK